tara:strand:- start:1464 stop:2279 length:816 start_codon:yes stop_codon:yes gene_type:complete
MKLLKGAFMPTALITGPTAGIGKALAFKLAKLGFNLLLVARREDRLKQIAKEIKSLHNVDVHIYKSDLKNPESPKNIYNYSESKKLDVEVLVLNAGYQHNKTLHEVSIEDEEDCLRVLGLSVIMQSKLFLKNFMKRGGGKILVVSSVAGFAPPSPKYAVLYGPVKTFMNRFVQAINAAYKKENITATALCPGFTVTEFHSVSGTQEQMDKVPSFMKMSADAVAEAGINGLLNKKEIVIPGTIYKVLVFILGLMPHSVIKFIGNKLAGGRFE